VMQERDACVDACVDAHSTTRFAYIIIQDADLTPIWIRFNPLASEPVHPFH
jgi:hypothetical protein